MKSIIAHTTKMQLCLLILVFLVTCECRSRSSMKLSRNGYEDLVISIQSSVEEDGMIITELKKTITDSSSYLYEASRHRAFIRQVTILIPSSWKRKQNYEHGQPSTFEHADVIIDKPHTLWGDNPYVKQPGGCGEEGQFIHLTPDFVLNTDGKRDLFGDAGRLFVHEFAHLRYGVFDEYSAGTESDLYPNFYLNQTGHLVPTLCSGDIVGDVLHIENYTSCDMDTETSIPQDKCDFFPDLQKGTAKTSIMSMQFLKSVVNFCESAPTDFTLQHNVEAPSKHNILCNYKGTWDVIVNHPDFANGANPPRIVNDTTPQFRLSYSQNTRRIVFVVDQSGSMAKNNRIFKLGQAFTKFLINELPLGIELAMITFSRFANVFISPIVIKNEVDKQRLADKIPTERDIGGTTSIGLGLSEALKVLQTNTSSTVDGSKIVLISDGQESVAPFMKTMHTKLSNETFIQYIVDSGVTVDTIGLGKEAEDRLEALSQKTGGTFYYYSENENFTTDVFSTAFSDIGHSLGGSEITLSNYVVTIANGSVHHGFVLLDDSVGMDTKFVFSFPQGANYNVNVTSPENEIYNSNEYNNDTTFNIAQVHVPKAKAGNWTYSVYGYGIDPVVVDVKTSVRNGTYPIKCFSWLNKIAVIFPEHIIIYAEVSQGYAPILDAQIVANVDRPHADPIMVMLYDNGLGADTTKDDGIYSAFLVNLSGNGRYTVEVSAKNKDGQTRVIQNGNGVGSGARAMYSNVTHTFRTKQLLAFERTSLAGSLSVQNFTGDPDTFPPGQVRDLRVNRIRRGSGTMEITLTWTAPGGNLDQGIADWYDIRMDSTFVNILNKFNAAEIQISNHTVINGSVKPASARQKQLACFAIPETFLRISSMLYFAIKAVDEKGIYGQMSNIASGKLSIDANITSMMSPTAEITKINLSTTDTDHNAMTAFVKQINTRATDTELLTVSIGLSCFILILAIILILVTLVYKKRQKIGHYDTRVDDNSTDRNVAHNEKGTKNPFLIIGISDMEMVYV